MGLGGSGWMDGSVIEVFESLLSSPCGFPSQWMVAPSLQPVPLALSKVSSVPLKLAWAKGHLRSWGRKTVPGVEGWAACLLCPLPWHQHTWEVGVGSQSGSLFPSAFRFGAFISASLSQLPWPLMEAYVGQKCGSGPAPVKRPRGSVLWGGGVALVGQACISRKSIRKSRQRVRAPYSMPHQCVLGRLGIQSLWPGTQ